MEMTLLEILLLAVLILIVAALYSSVGHGGASGYLAVMSFIILDSTLMSTTALILNILVAGIGTIQFSRAGHFSWKLAWPFILLSVPLAFVGGILKISALIYSLLLAGVLLFASYRLIRGSVAIGEEPSVPPSLSIALGAGGGIGLLSGIVGVGGGIFLSPIMILMKWATIKQTAAISAFFIVVNSIAGLAGRFVRGGLEVGTIWPFVLAAAAGGMIGSYFGAGKFTSRVLRQILGIVLLIAALKLVITVF
ncbi:MAG: sulfite exporter TauE/SafE family protein [Bacteroidota bacterium]